MLDSEKDRENSTRRADGVGGSVGEGAGTSLAPRVSPVAAASAGG